MMDLSYTSSKKPSPVEVKPGMTIRGRVPKFEEPPLFLTIPFPADEPAPRPTDKGKRGGAAAAAKKKEKKEEEEEEVTEKPRTPSKPFRLPFELKPPTVSITGAPILGIDGLFDLVGGETVHGAPVLQHESGRCWLSRSRNGFWVATNRPPSQRNDGGGCLLLSSQCQLPHPCEERAWASWNGVGWEPCPAVSVEYLWDEALRRRDEPELLKTEASPTAQPAPDAPVGGGCSTLNTAPGPSAGKAGVPYHCRVLKVGGKLVNHV